MVFPDIYFEPSLEVWQAFSLPLEGQVVCFRNRNNIYIYIYIWGGVIFGLV